jgi:peptide chain release factor 2
MNIHVNHLTDLKRIATNENDENLLKEIKCASEELEKELTVFETKTKLIGQYDKKNAIVSIHAGAGGIESCDWVGMLARMYFKWAEKKGFEINITNDLNSNDEAGSKNVTIIIKGEYTYGFLCSEIGVHRLVRFSPFDSNRRRHTSFCSVDVIPEIDDTINIFIDDKDIRIDTYRASGAGGQHVNKTDSAVRITHISTGLVVQSQNDRSQMRNKIVAMKLLKSKLYELKKRQQFMSYKKHHIEKGFIKWGNQIRSYIFVPYQLVKDHRTGYKVSQIASVMDGEIDEFINAYLLWKIK